jgi:hypothetical protein
MIARALAIAAAAAVGLCACGGDELTRQEYETRVGDVVDSVSTAVNVSPETPPFELRDRLGDASDSLHDAAGELEDIEPPDDAAEGHALLVDAVHELADEVGELAEETADIDDPVELANALGDLQQFPALEELSRASRLLTQAGYSFD